MPPNSICPELLCACGDWRDRGAVNLAIPFAGGPPIAMVGPERVGRGGRVKLINLDGMAIVGPGSEWFWTMLQFIALAITFYAIYRQLRAQYVQIRANTNLLRSQAHYNAIMLGSRPLEMLIEDERLAAVVNLGQATPEALDVADRTRFSTFSFLQFNAWEYFYYQHRRFDPQGALGGGGRLLPGSDRHEGRTGAVLVRVPGRVRRAVPLLRRREVRPTDGRTRERTTESADALIAPRPPGPRPGWLARHRRRRVLADGGPSLRESRMVLRWTAAGTQDTETVVPPPKNPPWIATENPCGSDTLHHDERDR